MKIVMTFTREIGRIVVKVDSYEADNPMIVRRNEDRNYVILLASISETGIEGVARVSAGSLYSRMFYEQRTRTLRLMDAILREGVCRSARPGAGEALRITGILEDVDGVDEVSFIES